MTLKRSLSLLVVTAAICAMGAVTAIAGGIKFGVAAEPYPPYASKDATGVWVGWEIDLMNALCAAMKEECELTEVAWDGIIPALTSKKIDVIFASMSITDERRKTINFSTWYYNTAIGLIGAKNGDLDISPAHLAGKIIGAQVSTINEKYVTKYFVPAGAELKTYATLDEADNDLSAGRLDYVQADSTALNAFLASTPGICCELKGLVPGDQEVLGYGSGAGIRKDDTALLDKINAGLADLAKADAFDQLVAKYPELKGQILVPQP